MLQIGRNRGHRADGCRVERAPHEGERETAEDAAAQLELLRVDVLVRHAIPEEVQERPDCGGRPGRADERTAHGARGKVERDDQ